MIKVPDFNIWGPFVIAQSVNPNLGDEPTSPEQSFSVALYPDMDSPDQEFIETLFITGNMTIDTGNWIAGCLVQLNIRFNESERFDRTVQSSATIEDWVNDTGRTIEPWISPLLLHKACSALASQLGQMPLTDIELLSPSEWKTRLVPYSSDGEAGTL